MKLTFLVYHDILDDRVTEALKELEIDFYTQWEPIVTLKNSLLSTEEVLDGEKGPFNVAKYDKALMDMLYSVISGIDAGIKQTLSD